MELIKELNFKDYCIGGKNTLVRREEGWRAKYLSRINELELRYETIHIIIPKEIMTINPPFLEVLFHDVIKKLGEKKFKERFFFECQGTYKIETDLDEAIDRILRESGMK